VHNQKIQDKLPTALADHFLKRNLEIPDQLNNDAIEVLKLIYKESCWRHRLLSSFICLFLWVRKEIQYYNSQWPPIFIKEHVSLMKV
jgi:hypothetical protein